MKFRTSILTAIAGAALLATSGGAGAQAPGAHKHHPPAHHAPSGKAPSIAEPASTTALRAANDRMHADMAIELSGNADVDFMRGMIPHHQGAVDMAKVVLEHGKDPQVRRLAEEVIRTQEAEIATMKKWLAARGH